VGLAIAEGRLRLDDPVLKFFPDDAPSAPSTNLQAMRIADLLRMSTGQETEPPRTSELPWAKSFLAHPVPFKPGTHFLYNTSATYMQSAIIQQVTGQTLLDYLRPRLFEPLGIEDPTWEMSPQGICTGGFGLSIRTEDIAKFGQLYLQRGRWGDRQLVPADWIAAATAAQTSNGSNPNSDWDQGYGYQFWRCRHGAYRADGAFGQYCIVLPEQDAVIAITSGVRDMQAVLNVVWQLYLPALTSGALPENDAAVQQLRHRLKSLTVRLPDHSGERSPAADQAYVFPANELKLETVAFEPSADDAHETLVVRVDGVTQRIACGCGIWQEGTTAWDRQPPQPAATAGGWTGDTFVAKICFYETPFIVTLKLKYSEGKLLMQSETNVGFGSTKRPELVGVVEASRPNTVND
jgi:hypothetical protein